MTPELFQKYLDGLCTKEEKDEVEHWLHTSADAQLDEVLWPRFNNNMQMPVQPSKQLWSRVAPPVRMPYLAIAASLLILIWIGWWMTPVQQRPTPVIIVKQDTTLNTGHHRLPDGSTVEIGARSSLTFQKNFQHRNLQLQGQALFKVAKNKTRPFTVHSGNISTTALGTEFMVTTARNAITVKLLEGKVVVKHGAETYLTPGQQLVYDLRKQTAIVHKPSRPKRPVRIQQQRTRANLAFDNTPLPEVLETLKIQYTANISYDKTTLDGLYFTGTIAVTDALPVLLKAISHMNGLQVQVHSNRYVIQPISN